INITSAAEARTQAVSPLSIFIPGLSDDRARVGNGPRSRKSSAEIVRSAQKSAGGPPGPVVVAEVDRCRPKPAELVEGLAKARDVLHHPLERRLTFEHLDGPAGIAGQQSRPRRGIDRDALMAGRMAGG